MSAYLLENKTLSNFSFYFQFYFVKIIKQKLNNIAGPTFIKLFVIRLLIKMNEIKATGPDSYSYFQMLEIYWIYIYKLHLKLPR